MPGLSRNHGSTQVSAPTTAPATSTSTQSGGGRGNAFRAEQLGQQQAGPQCTTTGPTGDYVTMGPEQKADYLAELFATPDVSTTFSKRGFNNADQAQLAGIMQNEGGLNERRRMLGSHYASAARSLVGKLRAAGVALGALAGAEQNPKVRLTEDERAVLSAAQSGAVDLAALSGSGDAQKQAQEALTNVGVDHQTALYTEYSALAARQRGGERLGRDDAARLAALSNRSLYSSGSFDDARGMSAARFRSVYDEGQTRFEPSRYARSRNAIERWQAGGQKGAGAGVGAGGESARDWTARHPEALSGNHDALADAETSWGTAQIMGHYADRGDLKNADGARYTMDDMRASAGRRSPNGTDVDMQISYFRDIANVPGHLGSAEDVSVVYNGPAAPQSYADGLRENAARYERARRGVTPCPPDRRAGIEDELARYA